MPRVALAALLGLTLLAEGARAGGQRGLDGLGGLATPERPGDNTPYDGQFTFVRVTYDTLPGGRWYRGQPAWSHGYPVAERNLMNIVDALTTLRPHIDEVNALALDDPDLLEYPVAYLIEAGWWDMTDAEAAGLRDYLRKGGFLIIDDFKLPGGIGGGGWDQFAANMARVLPDARFVDMDVSHPIFHVFFDIASFDIVPQAYNAGRPIFRGLYEDNDPTKRLQMIVNYNTDISQFWEWSARGFRPVAETNEAYKLGVNYIVYGITH